MAKGKENIIIIGGGASALAAAITIRKKRKDLRVLVLEKKEIPGKKLRATGNGRCNLTNLNCKNHKKILRFFSDIGIMTREDDSGRVYPYNEDAGDLTDAMISKAEKLGVKFLCNSEVVDIYRKSEPFDSFVIIYKDKFSNGNKSYEIQCDKVLLACGGKAGPQFGTTGDGYIIARRLGHNVTPLAPALTGIEIYDDLRDFSGIRSKVNLKLIYEENVIWEEYGELQFTDYGISGICAFNMSSAMVIPKGRSLKNGFDDYKISIDFVPDYLMDDLKKIISNKVKKDNEKCMNPLSSIVKKQIGLKIWDMEDGNILEIAKRLKNFVIMPKGLKGWKNAQVTRGGIPYNDVNVENMESKIISGMFFSGEIMDYAGPCGGYNLQNAWETGIKAGYGILGERYK